MKGGLDRYVSPSTTSSKPRSVDENDLGEVEEVEMTSMTSRIHEHEAAPQDPLIAHNDDDDDRVHDTNNDNATRSQTSANLFVWMLTISAGVSSLLFGYDTGVISSTLVSIGTDLSARHLTTLDKSLITSCTSLFALIASPAAGWLADKTGRKKVILVSDALFTFGAIWQALTTSVWGMIVGRSLVGLAIGGASMITPLYISELAPGHLRGRLVTVSLLFTTGGQVVAYVIGWLFSTMPGGWRWMVGLGAVPSLVQLMLLFFMPETPRYLARADQEERARIILRKIYKGLASDTNEIADDILVRINKEILEEEEAKVQLESSTVKTRTCLPPTLRSLLFHPPHARALTIACLLQGLQQCCGFNSLMYFSATIFKLLQFSSPTLTSLSIAITNFVFTIVAFYLMDRLGRRRILLVTIPIMIIALVLCSLAFTFITLPSSAYSDDNPPPPPLSSSPDTDTDTSTRTRLPAISILLSLLLYVSSYATGLGPVPWQQSELFPLSVRSLGSSLATSTNWGTNTIIGLTFLPMMQALTPGWTFVTYAIICAVGLVAVWTIYPETKGLDLEDVGELLRDGWGVKESVERANAVDVRNRRRRRRDRDGRQRTAERI